MGATAQLEILLRFLHAARELDLNGQIKAVIAARGSAYLDVCGDDWCVEGVSNILGCRVQDDGGISNAWPEAFRRIWGVVVGECPRT